MADWNAIQAFMAHVVPWPASAQDAGYVNLHFSSIDRKDPTKLHKGGGWPFRSVESFIGRCSWINTTDQFKDVWYCLSLQSQVKPNPRNPAKPKAQRLAANALRVKALWIDADVGDKKGEYATLEDALKALILFREKRGLPQYSALVASGNGLHAYWISKTPLSVREWAPYAEGLRAILLADNVVKDPGVTTDVARILRVPGTFNHKTTPPKPVLLLNTPLVMYDFPTSLALLPIEAPETSTVQGASAPAHPLFAEGVSSANFKGTPILAASADDTLQAGIDKHDDVLLDPRPIFTNCDFYREALRTGGADYDNALWMYSVLGATFMENGNAIAHEISKGHTSYSQVDTQALYDRKLAERADRGLGYPSCTTIAGAGCKSCPACPLFAKGKSPLNIRPVVTATVSALNMALPSTQSQGAKDLSLPFGYDLDDEGFICEVQENTLQGEALPPTLHRLFLSKLSDPWAQSNPDCLNFTTTVDKGNIYQASIRHEDMGAMGLGTVFAQQKVKIFPRNKALLEHFVVSWLAKLHEMNAAQQSLPFGWYKEGDLTRGFVYGSKLMKDDGSENPCGVGDAKLRAIFHPVGDINHWFTACKTITNQKRPELDAIIALSFASPLTALVGKNAMTLCAYGDSGAGKTAAYSVGISVWGHSVMGKAVSHSTFNAVMRKMGELANLPLYWDEIKDPKAQLAVYDFIYTASDGKEKDRMKDGRDMQTSGSWQTQMMMASNKSFTDFILTKDIGHVAGLSRVLEYHVAKADGGPGRIKSTDADVIFDKLKTSFGQIGLRYAKLLAMNHVAIAKQAIDTCNQVDTDMNATTEERLWVALVGTLLVGAQLANELGCELDVPALKDFLYKVYRQNRQKRDDMVPLAGAKDTTSETMSEFFAKVATNDQMLWTKGMPVGAGKPMTDAVSIVHQPRDSKNVAVMMGVSVRWEISERRLYISKKALVDYLEENNLPVGTVLVSLQRSYKMERKPKTSIGAGVYDLGRITCLVFNIGAGHEWEQLLYRYTPLEERPASPDPVGASVEPVDTGFETDATTGLATAASVQTFVQGAARGP
jgi:Domain of unknown function (DUF927)